MADDFPGLTTIQSSHSFDETVARIEGVLKSKGIKLFAVIDHSCEAEKAGLKMPPTKVLIFGNPIAGTPIMLQAPSSAIDLPLKILVAEDTNGKVSMTHNDPEYLEKRHGISSDLLKNIAGVAQLVEAAKQTALPALN